MTQGSLFPLEDNRKVCHMCLNKLRTIKELSDKVDKLNAELERYRKFNDYHEGLSVEDYDRTPYEDPRDE